jgi:hypothetical protein
MFLRNVGWHFSTDYDTLQLHLNLLHTRRPIITNTVVILKAIDKHYNGFCHIFIAIYMRMCFWYRNVFWVSTSEFAAENKWKHKPGLEENTLLWTKFKAFKCAFGISTAGLNSVKLHLLDHMKAETQRPLRCISYTEMRLICTELLNKWSRVLVATNTVNAI